MWLLVFRYLNLVFRPLKSLKADDFDSTATIFNTLRCENIEEYWKKDTNIKMPNSFMVKCRYWKRLKRIKQKHKEYKLDSHIETGKTYDIFLLPYIFSSEGQKPSGQEPSMFFAKTDNRPG